MTRACSGCGGALSAKNVSGYCKRCLPAAMAANPAIRSRQRAGLQTYLADPERRAAHVARCIENGKKITPAQREARREAGRRRAPLLISANLQITPEQRAANGRKRSETVLAWCPPEWRDKYRDLKKRGRRAADAKRIVLGLIAGRPEPVLYAQQKAKLAWCPPGRRAEYEKLRNCLGAEAARKALEAELTPFERQLARVAAGANLIVKPVIRRPGPAYTLGGVAPEGM